MRVIVFGASGATGRQLVGQALADGHQVTAFVRNVSRLDTRSGQLTVVVGDVAQETVVASAVGSQDGVLCALGAATPLSRDRTLVEGVAISCAPWNGAACGVSCTCRFSGSGRAEVS